MSASFNEFATLCEALASTSRKLEKRSKIAEWLRLLSPQDAGLGALYLAGQAFPERERRSLNLGGSVLSRAVMQLTGASDAVLHQAYLKHGDLGAAAFGTHVGKADRRRLTRAERCAEGLRVNRRDRTSAGQTSIHYRVLSQCAPLEAKYLIKLALGDMRTGVRQSLIEEAIAEAYSAEISRPPKSRHAVWGSQ